MQIRGATCCHATALWERKVPCAWRQQLVSVAKTQPDVRDSHASRGVGIEYKRGPTIGWQFGDRTPLYTSQIENWQSFGSFQISSSLEESRPSMRMFTRRKIPHRTCQPPCSRLFVCLGIYRVLGMKNRRRNPRSPSCAQITVAPSRYHPIFRAWSPSLPAVQPDSHKHLPMQTSVAAIYAR